MTISRLRDNIADVLAHHPACNLKDEGYSAEDVLGMADVVIAALEEDGWTLAPPDVAMFTGTYVGDGRGSYAAGFCRGGCDCSCCYGMADEPCHCQDVVCNCGGDQAAHGQKPLEDK